jgi:hypothetical protein
MQTQETKLLLFWLATVGSTASGKVRELGNLLSNWARCPNVAQNFDATLCPFRQRIVTEFSEISRHQWQRQLQSGLRGKVRMSLGS